MSKHTPGPWEVLDFGEGPIIQSKKPANPIAGTFGTKKERLSNARLIAAAPELLEAVRNAAIMLQVAAHYAPNDSVNDIHKYTKELLATRGLADTLKGMSADIQDLIAKAEGK